MAAEREAKRTGFQITRVDGCKTWGMTMMRMHKHMMQSQIRTRVVGNPNRVVGNPNRVVGILNRVVGILNRVVGIPNHVVGNSTVHIPGMQDWKSAIYYVSSFRSTLLSRLC